MTSLYIHIPFCDRKCFYCSFVISVGQTHRVDRYLDCLEREARQYHGMEIQSIYIGGGTPSTLSEKQLKKLFNMIHTHFRFSENIESTIEANPEGIDISKLKMIKGEGINRISLGVQSLNDKYLKYLGRIHDARSAVDAFGYLRKAGFDNINVDMMFSYPKQSNEELIKDIHKITQLGSEHISLYSLTIEKYSRFYTQNVVPKDSQIQARQYEIVCELLGKKGFKQYEVSNFAKLNNTSIHNLNYWQGGHYVGLGIGAHSHLGSQRSWNVSRLIQYISCIEKGLSVREDYEELTPYTKMKEVVLFGLRMNQGIDINQIKKRFGCYFKEQQQEQINHFIDGGLLIAENGRLRASSKGRLVLDELCSKLI